MSRFRALLGLASRLPTVTRTLLRLRPPQALAQLRHMFFGARPPVQLAAEKSPRLAEVRCTSFLGPPRHIRVSRAPLAVELLGRRHALGPSGIDWRASQYGPLFEYHLNEHAFLRHEAFTPVERARLVNDWIQQPRLGAGWDPHPTSLRLLAWGKLLLTPEALPGEPGLRESMCLALADQAESLSRSLEHRLQANHLLSNRIGVVWAGLLFEGGQADVWRAQIPALAAELALQVHADGGHEERSPMYHSLILENVLDLLNLAQASPRATPEFVALLRDVAARMLSALALYTRPDGRIALFADSAWGVACEPASLFDYARTLEVACERTNPRSGWLAESGYARLVRDGFDVIVSLEGPRPAHQPGHAHCDALALELAVGGQGFVGDTGVFEYQPGRRRDQARATASHATLELDAREQSELWAAHRVGGRARVDRIVYEASGAVSGRVTGWGRAAASHARRVALEDGALVVVDRVDREGTAIVSRWPIVPGWRLERVTGGVLASCEEEDVRVRVELPEALDWEVERAPFFPTFHQERQRDVLVGRGTGPLEATLRFVRVG